jgi:hypothetical protein
MGNAKMGSGNEDRSTTHGRELCSHNADLKGELKRFRPIRDRSSEIEKKTKNCRPGHQRNAQQRCREPGGA